VQSLIAGIFNILGLFVFFLTGEVLLYVITFGKHSIRKSIRKSDEEGDYVKGQLYFESSYYVGIAFWIVVIVAVYKYLL
jgi:hypothetical protein